MKDDIAIKVDGVSKYFAPPRHTSSLKGVFTNLVKSSDKPQGGKDDEGYWALKDISFEIKKGEFFGIVGRNGSGKSTLLKIIAGVYTPTGGSVEVNGKLVPFIELGVGFNPELTGRDNVFLNGALLGFSRAEMTDMYDEIVEFAELEDHMDVPLKNYSSGMQVRLAFSIAIRSDADILLIDEVLAVGDANFQKKCFDFFYKLRAADKTVVFVSHDMDIVRRFCSHGVYLRDSEIEAFGSVDEIAEQYNEEVIGSLNKALEFDSGSAADTGHLKQVKPVVVEDVRCLNKDSAPVQQGDRIMIEVDYHVNTDVESPILGVLLFASSNPDAPVFGVNTDKPNRIQMKKTFKSGEKITLSVNVENRFSQGGYFVRPAVAEKSGVVVYDSKDSGQLFVSSATKNNFSLFQSEYNIELKVGEK